MSKVVVAGGSSGIGEATAARFLCEGDEVVIVGRDASRLAAAAARMNAAASAAAGAAGRPVAVAVGVVADARQPDSLRDAFDRVGAFDHLVLTLSGGKGAGPFASLPLDDIRSGMEAKLFAQLNVLQAALPHVTQSVTIVTAASARAALAGTSGLAAINGGLEAMVRPLATELAPRRVNAVSPGVIDTPWWDAMPAAAKAAHFEQSVATLPVGRVGQPDDVAAMIVAVARNAFMTGSVVEVAGGLQLPR